MDKIENCKILTTKSENYLSWDHSLIKITTMMKYFHEIHTLPQVPTSTQKGKKTKINK